MAKILMLCHDQHMDRRVLAQAKTLINSGQSVELIALSYDSDNAEETLDFGLHIHRIGLARVVPENRIYTNFQKRQNWLLKRIYSNNNLQRWFSSLSKFNWNIYLITLLTYYRNRQLHDPLPFRSAFYSEGIKHKADIVHVHDLPALQAGAELADTWGVPLVYDAHELYPEQAAFSSTQKKICSINERKYIQRANIVLAVNESIATLMATRYGIKKPTEILNALDPDPAFIADREYNLIREKTGISKDGFILLFQGGFSPNRNLENLIKAMAITKSCKVNLVMLGFGDYGKELMALSNQLQLTGRRVFFLDAVPQSELLQHSASADMGIIPYPHVDLNSYYCTPNKLFEFIQAGLPILTNDSPELRRFVRDRGFGMTFSMKSPEEMARAIDTACSSSDMIKDIATRVKAERVKYAWKSQEEIILAMYETILNE